MDNEIVDNLKSWDWNLFFKVSNKLGNQFNQPSWRMMKGEVICTALEVCSKGKALYVDEKGYDLIVDNSKIEVKTEKNIIKTNLDTKSIQLKNTRGQIQQFEKSFDYLLIANTSPTYIAALTNWETVYKNHRLTGDQIQCSLSQSELNFITSKNGTNIVNSFTQNDESLKDYMKDGIKKWIKSI